MATPVEKMENVLTSLRSIFLAYGYSEYKMNKFEEYDLYVKNKDFLISDNVITFTDTNGKLLALKPDVTLSIVKNSKVEDGLNKVFYSENVYRVSSKSNGYREIPQMGLECIGKLDDYNVSEVITLATACLEKISSSFVLDLSPVAIVSAVVGGLELSSPIKTQVYKAVNEKNAHELKNILTQNGVSEKDVLTLTTLVGLYGNVKEIMPKLKNLFLGTDKQGLVEEFDAVISSLSEKTKDKIKIDCSSCENVKYYNGITFKGYVEGVPKAVLSGGRYDGLLKIMGKDSEAIGFAIYPDEFDRLFYEQKQYDVDVVLLYTEKTQASEVLKKAEEFISQGKTVSALKSVPETLTYKEVIKM